MMQNDALNAFLAQADYAPWHTGGGCMAWRKDTGRGTYLLLANEDVSLTGDFTTAEWSVARYSDLHEGFVALSASLLVRDAVRLADRLPQPTHEQVYIELENLLPVPGEDAGTTATAPDGYDLTATLELRAIVRGSASEETARGILLKLMEAITKAHECVDGSKYQIAGISEFSISDPKGDIKASYFSDGD